MFCRRCAYVFPLFAFCVFSAAVNSESGEEVAIKKVGNAFDNHIDAKRTLREIKLLRHMDHENVRMHDNCLWSLDISGVVILGFRAFPCLFVQNLLSDMLCVCCRLL